MYYLLLCQWHNLLKYSITLNIIIMENHKEEIVDVLNGLVEINNDRIEGYRRASEETEETDLKSLFASMADQSRTLRQQLADEVIRMGGEPKEGTTNSGKLYRIWMDVKAALTGKDRKAVLNNCEFGEDAALKAYDEAIKSEEVRKSFDIALIERQRQDLKHSHDKIKILRDSVTI